MRILGATASAYTPLPVVTGGTLTSDATYYYRTFTTNGTLAVSDAPLTVDLLIVAGGGGGGGFYVGYGAIGYGGGGAGGVLNPTSENVTAGSYAVVIGAGGPPAISGNGSNTTCFGYTSIGGGRAAGFDFGGNAYTSGNGGSGGGGHPYIPTGGSGTAGQGNNGGTINTYYVPGAGGGGKTAAGVESSGYPNGGTGGAGVVIYSRSVGGGGGGGSQFSTNGASVRGAASNGGGRGGYMWQYDPVYGFASAESGTVNTGGGGGGSAGTDPYGNGDVSYSASGGSGIVVVRYLRSAVGG
jgi:hypothetical protein